MRTASISRLLAVPSATVVPPSREPRAYGWKKGPAGYVDRAKVSPADHRT